MIFYVKDEKKFKIIKRNGYRTEFDPEQDGTVSLASNGVRTRIQL